MWSTTVSIDKRYAREFAYITGELSKWKYSSFAVGESHRRYFIDIACEEEFCAPTTGEIIRIITNVVLVYFKARYFKNKLAGGESGGLGNAMSILIAALIYFDVGMETNLLSGKIEASKEYAVDGMYQFKMTELIENWDELCELSSGLLAAKPDERDIFNLTTFLIDASDGKKNKILVEGAPAGGMPDVFNMSTKQKIFVHNIFDNEKQNLLCAIIGCYPKEIYVRNSLPFQNLDELKKLVKIKTADSFNKTLL